MIAVADTRSVFVERYPKECGMSITVTIAALIPWMTDLIFPDVLAARVYPRSAQIVRSVLTTESL